MPQMVMAEHGWPEYLDVEYKFRSGDEVRFVTRFSLTFSLGFWADLWWFSADQVPVELVGKDEEDSYLRFKLEESGNGDLVLVSTRASCLCLRFLGLF